MGAKDFNITLTWCEKHKNWWVTNCPDCMVDANEENIKQDGRREVVEWITEHGRTTYERAYGEVTFSQGNWQVKLKEWGL